MSQAAEALSPATTNPANSLYKRVTWIGIKERCIKTALMICALLSIATTLGILAILVTETGIFFNLASPAIANRHYEDAVTALEESGGVPDPAKNIPAKVEPSVGRAVKEFFTDTEWTPLFAEKHFGILPLLCGTMLVAAIASAIGIPIGLASAVYLSEYSSPRFRSIVKPTLEILAGIPTVVYGYFGLVFVTPYLLKPVFEDWLGFDVDTFNAASAGIVVGIMIIPTISSLSEDVLRAVPKGLREAAYGLGSTKFDVSVRIVVPAALSGILASFLLAISRAVGETMAVSIAAGQNPKLTLNPFSTVESMTAYIVNVSGGEASTGTVEYASLYAVAMTLFVITLLMNILAQWIMRRYREVYN